VVVDGTSFALNGKNVSYRFHVDEASGDIIADHFGGSVDETPIAEIKSNGGGWSTQAHLRREFPDLGRGDFRVPAVHIKHKAGHTVSDFKYKSHEVVPGKPALAGLPCTFGAEGEVTTLVLRMEDSFTGVVAELSYSVYPEFDAIVRSVKVTNDGPDEISIEKLASFSVDLPYNEYEMLQLQGEWSRECHQIRRKVDYGLQG
jgi:alpha-galactosidase